MAKKAKININTPTSELIIRFRRMMCQGAGNYHHVKNFAIKNKINPSSFYVRSSPKGNYNSARIKQTIVDYLRKYDNSESNDSSSSNSNDSSSSNSNEYSSSNSNDSNSSNSNESSSSNSNDSSSSNSNDSSSSNSNESNFDYSYFDDIGNFNLQTPKQQIIPVLKKALQKNQYSEKITMKDFADEINVNHFTFKNWTSIKSRYENEMIKEKVIDYLNDLKKEKEFREKQTNTILPILTNNNDNLGNLNETENDDDYTIDIINNDLHNNNDLDDNNDDYTIDIAPDYRSNRSIYVCSDGIVIIATKL